MHIISASFVEDADIDSHTDTSQDIVHSISRPTKRPCASLNNLFQIQVFFKAGDEWYETMNLYRLSDFCHNRKITRSVSHDNYFNSAAPLPILSSYNIDRSCH